MAQEKKYEKAWVDLREFGWGIREVRFIWPDGHDGGQPGPDSVGTDEIIDGGVHQEDLDPEIEAGENDIDSIFDDDEEGGASTQPTVPTQPLVVEEEEEP